MLKSKESLFFAIGVVVGVATFLLAIVFCGKTNSNEIGNILVSAVGVVIAALVFRFQISQDSFQKRQERPYLHFVRQNNAWHISNIGRVPVLNIRVSEMRNDAWIRPFALYSLPEGKSIKLTDVVNNAGSLAARYEDVFGEMHYVIGRGNSNTEIKATNEEFSNVIIILNSPEAEYAASISWI